MPRSVQDARDAVDLALVLAVDVSASVDFSEFGLMMGGYAAAFRDQALAERLASGPVGATAVAMLFWSGPGVRELAVPWRRLAAVADAADFADSIDATPRMIPAGATALGEGLAASLALLERCPYRPVRRVVDVSGDGRANAGLPLATARAAAELAGVTVNGLAVVNEEADLEDYYREALIVGPDAFVVRAEDYAAFAAAILGKLRREVGGAAIA